MKIDILTLFPEVFDAIKSSILARAEKKGLIEINLVNFRDYSKDKHKKVDDYPFGGGEGMLLAPQPIYDCIQALDKEHKAHRIYMSPKGETFSQEKAKQLAKFEHLIILCGHYEGVDQRVIDLCIDEEISIGDYVLTGGEIPAMVVADATARMVDGVLSGEANKENESFFNGFLEHPQYTRPQEFMGLKVPDVLVSGDHAKVDAWKKQNRKKIGE